MELKTVLDSGFYKIKDFVNRNLDSGFSSLVGFPISVLSCILDSTRKAHDRRISLPGNDYPVGTEEVMLRGWQGKRKGHSARKTDWPIEFLVSMVTSLSPW